ncbi:MAG: hypothetical protein ACLGIN_12700, partial [Candidatus Sericytochromatia bacterium]
TIGYDVPRARVEELVLEAARRTDGIADAPAPFVLVTGLGDFSISYELNAHTFYPHAKAVIYSELHKNLLDTFNEAGVEIMSPTYAAYRDGSPSTVAGDPAEIVVPQAPEAHRPTSPGAASLTEGVLRRYATHPLYRDAQPAAASPWEKEEPTA